MINTEAEKREQSKRTQKVGMGTVSSGVLLQDEKIIHSCFQN